MIVFARVDDIGLSEPEILCIRRKMALNRKRTISQTSVFDKTGKGLEPDHTWPHWNAGHVNFGQGITMKGHGGR